MLHGRRLRAPRLDHRPPAYVPWRLRALQAGAALFAGLLFLSLIDLVLR